VNANDNVKNPYFMVVFVSDDISGFSNFQIKGASLSGNQGTMTAQYDTNAVKLINGTTNAGYIRVNCLSLRAHVGTPLVFITQVIVQDRVGNSYSSPPLHGLYVGTPQRMSLLLISRRNSYNLYS
jgi:hypothetical protein